MLYMATAIDIMVRRTDWMWKVRHDDEGCAVCNAVLVQMPSALVSSRLGRMPTMGVQEAFVGGYVKCSLQRKHRHIPASRSNFSS